MRTPSSHRPKPPPLRKPAPPPPDVKAALRLLDCEAHRYEGYQKLPPDIDPEFNSGFVKPASYEAYLREADERSFRMGWHAALAHLRHHMGLP